MIWYIAGFGLWLVVIFFSISDYGQIKIGEWFCVLLALLIMTTIVNFMCAGILYALGPDNPADDPSLTAKEISYNELQPFTNENYVIFGHGKRYPTITCLLDNGQIKTYTLDAIETNISACADGEVPSVRIIYYRNYTDWRKWLTISSCYDAWTYITLPSGILYPIT